MVHSHDNKFLIFFSKSLKRKEECERGGRSLFQRKKKPLCFGEKVKKLQCES